MRQGPARVARVPVQTSQSRTLTWHELVGGCSSTAGKCLPVVLAVRHLSRERLKWASRGG